MVHEVITAPLRIAADAARGGLRVVGRAITLGLSATERLVDAAFPRPSGAAGAPHRAEASSGAPPPDDQGPPAPSNRPTEATPSPTSAPETPPAAPEAPTVAAAPAPTPAHVSRD